MGFGVVRETDGPEEDPPSLFVQSNGSQKPDERQRIPGFARLNDEPGESDGDGTSQRGTVVDVSNDERGNLLV